MNINSGIFDKTSQHGVIGKSVFQILRRIISLSCVRLQTVKLLFLCMMTIFVLSGCRPKTPEKAHIKITGPENMTVTIAGKTFSKGPYEFAIKPGSYIFKFSAPGHQSQWKKIELKANKSKSLKVELAPTRSAVLLESTPPRAQVVFNGSKIGSTPLVIDQLTPGRYSAALTLPGFAQKMISWTITGERPHAKIHTVLESSSGKITISTVPSKAKIFIDNQLVATSPWTTEWKEGKIKLAVEAEGYLPHSSWENIKRNSWRKLNIKLVPLPSSLKINSTPSGAEVFINDERKGLTPCVFENLIPGNYLIKITKRGREIWEKTIGVKAGVNDEIHADLLAATGSVMLQLAPAGLSVSVDGVPQGKTRPNPKRITETLPIMVEELTPGNHYYEVFHPRSKPVRKRFNFKVERGKQTVCSPQTIWVATTTLYYHDGTVRRGDIFSDHQDYIVFRPEPGITITVDKSDLKKIETINLNE